MGGANLFFLFLAIIVHGIGTVLAAAFVHVDPETRPLHYLWAPVWEIPALLILAAEWRRRRRARRTEDDLGARILAELSAQPGAAQLLRRLREGGVL